MPELPDVENLRRVFRRHAVGRTVWRVQADPSVVRNVDPATLDSALRGRRFDDPDRHGKWLIARTDGPTLLVHFGMTGDLIWSGDEPVRHRHDRVILSFAGGDELRYRNMRKLGGVWLAHDLEGEGSILGALGPDALAVRRTEFMARLGGRRGGLKATLMDQSFLAGVGNLVADEILWQARLHPHRPVASLATDERAALFRAMHRVLREAVAHYDSIPRKRSWLSHVRGRLGGLCPRCATQLERTVAGGRTTYFCPRCQPPPRP